jgi:hypothetical protein
MTDWHRIRLRGPWEVVPLDSGQPPARMTLPCSWRDGGWPEFTGRARHVRSFGKPRQFAATERIWLVVEGVTGQGQVCLNGHELGAIEGRFRRDITDLLEDRNRLEVLVCADSDAGGVTGEVALEIG